MSDSARPTRSRAAPQRFDVTADEKKKKAGGKAKAEKPAKKASTKGVKKTRKTKPIKDKNKPKRPQSSYMFFANAKRDEVKKQDPTLTSVSAIGKKLGELWNKLSDSEKEKYVKMAAKAKEEYGVTMKKYNATKDKEDKEDKEDKKSDRSDSDKKSEGEEEESDE